MPVEFRYVKDIYIGDKRMEMNVVPAFSVQGDAAAGGDSRAGARLQAVEREIHVTVTNGTKGAAQANVSLDLPAGWKATPASVPINFAHEDESLSARFQVTAPAQVKSGEYTLRAVVTSPAAGDQKFTDGYQEIEYPHVQRRQVIKPAETALKVVDVKIDAEHQRRLHRRRGRSGAARASSNWARRCRYIDQDELAWGDLSKYDVIMTGVRAYERRADLRAYNRRLLDYVERGGTVIVQYNKMEFNQAEYGPYPAKVSGNRVSDETVPVKMLAPGRPGVQLSRTRSARRRGPAGCRSAASTSSARRTRSTSIWSRWWIRSKTIPARNSARWWKRSIGKGRWIYLGLGLWRQLPAGTDGAYQLLANLISLPKARN